MGDNAARAKWAKLVQVETVQSVPTVLHQIRTRPGHIASTVRNLTGVLMSLSVAAASRVLLAVKKVSKGAKSVGPGRIHHWEKLVFHVILVWSPVKRLEHFLAFHAQLVDLQPLRWRDVRSVLRENLVRQVLQAAERANQAPKSLIGLLADAVQSDESHHLASDAAAVAITLSVTLNKQVVTVLTDLQRRAICLWKSERRALTWTNVLSTAADATLCLLIVSTNLAPIDVESVPWVLRATVLTVFRL